MSSFSFPFLEFRLVGTQNPYLEPALRERLL